MTVIPDMIGMNMTLIETWSPAGRCAEWCSSIQYRIMMSETVYIAISNIIACVVLYVMHRWPEMLDEGYPDKITRFGIWYLILTNVTFAVYIILRQRYI